MEAYAKLDRIFVRALGGDKSRGILQAGHLRIPCALGRSSISAFKREGDNATPLARMRIIGGFRRKDSRILPRCAVPLARMGKKSGWCDDPRDRNYNRPVRLPYGASSECLRREDSLYNIGFILDWNICPRVRNCGSAIFFHIARPRTDKSQWEGAASAQNSGRKSSGRKGGKSCAMPQFNPTAGCIAISERAMLRLLPHLHEGTEFVILG